MSQNLEGLNFYGDYTLDDNVVQNIIHYLRYGLLEIGAYVNISKGQTNYLGQNVSRLSPVFATGLTNYTVYRGAQNDWIWEQGINAKYPSGSPPFRVSGIYVNDTFYATGATIHGSSYYVDYSRGQVVFGTSGSANDKVEVAHSLRAVHVYPADGPEYRYLLSSLRDGADPTGTYDNSTKAYLPAIAVEMIGVDTVRGTEIGSRQKFITCEIEFDILASNSYEVKKLADICYMMETKTVPMFQLNDIIYPLNNRGELVNPTGTWPYLVNNYVWKVARFNERGNIRKIKDVKIPMFHTKVRIGLQLDVLPF